MVSSPRIVNLSGADGVLSMSIGNGGWTQVSLAAQDAHLTLGAEKLEYIVGKLTTFLEKDSSGLEWVLSLSEQHFSIYGENARGMAELKIQDADAKFVGTIAVDAARQREWLDALGSMAVQHD